MAKQIVQLLWLLVVLALSHSITADPVTNLYCELRDLSNLAQALNTVRCNYFMYS